MTGGKHFINGYKPVNVFQNNIKLAGWENETKTGETVEFENTYNDFAEVLVGGETEQRNENFTDISGVTKLTSSIISIDIPVSWSQIGKIELTATTNDISQSILLCRYSGWWIGINGGVWGGTAPYTADIDASTFADGNKHTVTFMITETSADTNNLRTVWDIAWSKQCTYHRIKFYDKSNKLLLDLLPISAGTVIKGVEAISNTMYDSLTGYILPVGTCISNTITIDGSQIEATTETQTYIFPSPDYPSDIKSVGTYNADTMKYEFDLVSSGNNLFDESTISLDKPLNKIGDVGDTYNSLTGEFVQRIGNISSYNGETITTAYVSTTGGLDVGAKVIYVLPTPITTYLTPTQVPTFYPTTKISTANSEIKPTLTATVKTFQ